MMRDGHFPWKRILSVHERECPRRAQLTLIRLTASSRQICTSRPRGRFLLNLKGRSVAARGALRHYATETDAIAKILGRSTMTNFASH